MNRRGRWLAFSAYLGIVALVAGGLAWVTHAALQLEESELRLRHSDTLRLALWRLDSRVFPMIAREDSRPVAHYDPLYPPLPALDRKGDAVPTGSVLVPSPLLSAELPPWMLLHFSVDSVSGWQSPQVIRPELAEKLRSGPHSVPLTNADDARRALFTALKKEFPAAEFIGSGQQPTDDTPAQVATATQSGEGAVQSKDAGQILIAENVKRASQQQSVRNENRGSEGANNAIFNYVPQSGVFFAEKQAEWSGGRFAGTSVMINLEPMRPRWLTGHDGVRRLMLLRPLQAKGITAVQGVLLDWEKLKTVLLEEVTDLLPEARLEPVDDDSNDGVRMTALPARLTTEVPTVGWMTINTPMRVGLVLAWGASALALAVVGLGGWTLLDLSERRFRFVTAVTHELRTPLTTLRLYTDMLTSGLVQSDKQRDEYHGTLNAEAERLHRLVGNVLDFARLERQTPEIKRTTGSIGDLFASLHADWECRCQSAGKEIVTQIAPTCPTQATTDFEMVRQILGNLIDNACKYSRDAADPHIWVRARAEGPWLVFTVEDRGPGVAGRESRRVFRPFIRGFKAPEVAGGVGLGLALSARWAHLLGGSLGLGECREGACFQLSIPKS
ncbi:MAG: sensor histidine kinase [Gemmataceae bacterium]